MKILPLTQLSLTPAVAVKLKSSKVQVSSFGGLDWVATYGLLLNPA